VRQRLTSETATPGRTISARTYVTNWRTLTVLLSLTGERNFVLVMIDVNVGTSLILNQERHQRLDMGSVQDQEPIVVKATISTEAGGQPAIAPPTPDTKAVEPEIAVAQSRQILRFTPSERRLHWSIAAPFLACLTSAVILVVFYNPHPLRPWRTVFSGIHRISGLCLILFPILTAQRHWRDYRIHFYNIRTAITWMRDDVKWLLLMAVATLNRKVPLPPQGKFNAAEKINFIMVMCTYPMFIVTGILMWTHKFGFASWMLHLLLVASAAPLIGGHIFMATINPSTRVGLSGMFTGFVDREWAQHHYTLWYNEKFESEQRVDESLEEVMTRKNQPALDQCVSEAD